MPRRDFDSYRRQMPDVPVTLVRNVAIGVLVLIVLIVGVATSMYQVEADEVGVVQRFGEYIEPPVGSGLHWKLPFFIERVDKVRVDRNHTLEFGFRDTGTTRQGRTMRTVYRDVPDEALMLTGDQNVASVGWIVQYKIKDPAHWLFRVRNPEDTIRDVSESTMRLVVGDSSATEVLTARREEIEMEVEEKLQETLDDYQSGVLVVTVELQDVVPPTKAVQDSFNEVNRARQEMDTTINKANREYLKAIPEAEGEARRVVQEAEGYLLKRVNEAKGDTARFEKLLAEYENAKEITRRRLYLEAVQEVLPRLARIYVIDAENGGPLQVLDLERVLGAAARSGSAPPARATSRRTTGRSPRR